MLSLHPVLARALFPGWLRRSGWPNLRLPSAVRRGLRGQGGVTASEGLPVTTYLGSATVWEVNFELRRPGVLEERGSGLHAWAVGSCTVASEQANPMPYLLSFAFF